MRSLLYRLFCYLLIICVLLSGTALSGQLAYADDDAAADYITFMYDSFPAKENDSRIRYNFDATSVGGKMRLTPASANKRGSVFNKEKVSLKDDRSFSTYFTYEITGSRAWDGGPRGGDGIVFLVQTFDNTAATSGGSLGYYNILQSVAVKFDTWQNSEHQDPSDNSIAILQNGDIHNPIALTAVDPAELDLMTGTIHAWIDYDGPQGLIEVRVSKNANTRPADPILSYTFDADQRLTQILNSDRAYVGFTSATGGSYQNHDITSWYFTNKYDPIDVNTHTYTQAPGGYTLSTEALDDGTVELSITALGENTSGVPLTVTVADGMAVASPSSVTTDADGEAVSILSSSDNSTIESTVTVEGPGGVNASADVTIPGRTAAPALANIVANATSQAVRVNGVPEGATVTVYDHEGNVIASETGVTGGEALFEGLSGLSVSRPIEVTFHLPPQVESMRTSATPKANSSVLDAADVDANAVTDKLTVGNVPKDAAIIVYDDNGNVLDQKTNTGTAAAPLEFDDLGLEADQVIYLTIIEDGGFESEPLAVTVTVPALTLSTRALEDGTTELSIKATGKHAAGVPLTIAAADTKAVASPSTVTTDEDGEAVVILSSSDNSTIVSTVTVEGPGGVNASAGVTITGRTAAPVLANIVAKATSQEVRVQGVPEGATVTVYDHEGNVIASETGVTGGEALFEGLSGLSVSNQIEVTFHLPPQVESMRTAVTPIDNGSAPPSASDVLDIDTENGTITVDNVPPGATVTIYDEEGNAIGQGTNGGATAGEVTVTVDDVPLEHPVIRITITEPDKVESEPLTIDVEQNTQEAIEEAIRDLEIGFQADDTWESVTLPIFVVSVGSNNTSVHWTSSKPDIVEITDPVNTIIEALVHRQETDASVILTAEVAKNGVKRTRTFLVIVKAVGLVKTIDAGQRQVNVTGGEDGQVSKPLDIDRILLSDGSRTIKIDKTIFDLTKANEFVNEPGSAGSLSSIYVDSVANDEADEIAIEVPEETLALLFGNGNSLEVRTDAGTLSITNAVLGEMVDSFLDLFFRIVPVKDADRQNAIHDVIRDNADVRAEANGRTVRVLGSSLEIETNYAGYSTTLFLPFAKNGIIVPDREVASFLNSLRVYIEHSDGTTSFVSGAIVNDAGGVPIGLSIAIDKFSTFSIVQLEGQAPYMPVVIGEQSSDNDRPGFHAAYISGFADGTFRPDQAITRAEMAAILSRNLALTEPDPYERLFPDVPEAHWASAFIGRLHRAGLMIGDRQGMFRPNSWLTRAELAMIAVNWLKLDMDEAREHPFPDVAGSHWASGAIAAVYEAGIVLGFPDGTFGADQPVTRAEAVTMLNRLLGRKELASVDHPTWRDVPTSHWAFNFIEEASREHHYTVTAEGTEELVEREETSE